MADADSVETQGGDVGEWVKVHFHPQIWSDGQAVTGDDTETFYVPREDATDDQGALFSDESPESETLCRHENATERAQNWYGPFYVTLSEVDVLPSYVEPGAENREESHSQDANRGKMATIDIQFARLGISATAYNADGSVFDEAWFTWDEVEDLKSGEESHITFEYEESNSTFGGGQDGC
ncbi:hypothetical protein HLRTI_000484 [Halorhabdus tiamatea SARL4B]|uniref:Uncharacterized protein n=1 Tax=Halorhabdus tiamatea SARL4B TaxID=1033806 RepID=F7PMI9_9EURY|nr:hypothetical protein [Halorhabdus tiamatea]ERJ07442.1 hypothetical protein HLRTI_000484 [Halorhabdus tiamatea SARL4B]